MNKQESTRSIDRLEEYLETIGENVEKRLDPKTIQEMYLTLKGEIDNINNKPENKRYLEDFVTWKENHEKKGRDVQKYILEGIKTLNIKTLTGKSKYEEYKGRKHLDTNNANIDSKGVYKIIELLEDFNIISEETEKKYLEGKSKAQEGIALNEEMHSEGEGLFVKNFKPLNLRKGKSPLESALIDINSNLKTSDGPTSSTRMIYELLKKAGIIQKLPAHEQKILEKFIYFVDFAYRFKQRIYGMDARFVHGTLLGNYKRLSFRDIRQYFDENPDKTGFEPLTEEQAQQLKIFTKEGGKDGGYKMNTMESLINKKQKQIQTTLNQITEIEDNWTLTYEGGKGYKKQNFIFDIEGKLMLMEEVAPIRKLGFCKLHPNNEIYIRSYYDLPTNFGGFITENGNTVHGKLTDTNIEQFLSIFEGTKEIKEKIKNQYKKNKLLKSGEKTDIQVGEKYTGIITQEKDFGIFVQIKKGSHILSGLLHKSEIINKEQKYKKGDSIDVIIKNITPEKKIGFGLVSAKPILIKKEKISLDTIQIGKKYKGYIANISDKNMIFVKIQGTNVMGILQTNFPKKMIKDIFVKGENIDIKLIKKTEKGPVFEAHYA